MRGYEFYDTLHSLHMQVETLCDQLKAANDELATLRTWARDAHKMLRFVQFRGNVCPDCLVVMDGRGGVRNHTSSCRLRELLTSGADMKLDRQEA